MVIWFYCSEKRITTAIHPFWLNLFYYTSKTTCVFYLRPLNPLVAHTENGVQFVHIISLCEIETGVQRLPSSLLFCYSWASWPLLLLCGTSLQLYPKGKTARLRAFLAAMYYSVMCTLWVLTIQKKVNMEYYLNEEIIIYLFILWAKIWCFIQWRIRVDWIMKLSSFSSI